MLNTSSARSQALTSLVRALEEVDMDTEEHVKRTQQMGIALGHKIGLSDAQLTSLQLLCLLHDIGKITVPLEILNKPGRLTDEEWSILRSHSEKGYQIAMSSEELRPIAEMILHHHERWDGNGYPARLVREEIPVLSRIISIVDAYDAMVNDRAYRKAMLPGKAMQEIRDNAGTQFDLVPIEEKDYYIQQVHNQFAKSDTAYLRHPIRRKDGKVITVICNGERYYDSSVKAFRSTIMMFEVD